MPGDSNVTMSLGSGSYCENKHGVEEKQDPIYTRVRLCYSLSMLPLYRISVYI